jgi:hypothetical protein
VLRVPAEGPEDARAPSVDGTVGRPERAGADTNRALGVAAVFERGALDRTPRIRLAGRRHAVFEVTADRFLATMALPEALPLREAWEAWMDCN